MKKIFIIIGILISMVSLSAYADETRVEVLQWTHQDIQDGRERAPLRLPTIEIVFDSDNLSIEIMCSADCEASVFLYDENGNLIDSADSLDSILYVTGETPQVFHILIESELWYAYARIKA